MDLSRPCLSPSWPSFLPSLWFSSANLPVLSLVSQQPFPSFLLFSVTKKHTNLLNSPGPIADNVVHMAMKGPVSPHAFSFYWTRKELTGDLKSCRKLHTQSPIIGLSFSLSSCLCWCCVDKTSTNYSVGCWLWQCQQNVEVTYWEMQQMGFLGGRNQQWLFPKFGFMFICSKSS